MKKEYLAMAEQYALIDLHLHLDGSLSLESVKELAAIQNIDLSDSDEKLLKKLQVDEDCRDLNQYLEKFDFPLSLLQTKEAIAMAVYNLGNELKKQGLIYGEIRFAPQLHMQNGLTQEEVVKAAIIGMEESGFAGGLILCCMRGDANQEANMETVRVAGEYVGKGVCALDLAGAEALYPTEDFKELFDFANELKVPYTIHAGEAAGPESVRKALKFGASRIGHGVRSIEDEALMQTLSREGISLELCPTSNLNTNIFQTLEQYPLRKFLEAGIKITINTDNMTVSNTTLKEEYARLIEVFNLSSGELELLVRNSVEASFADKGMKQWIVEQVNCGV